MKRMIRDMKPATALEVMAIQMHTLRGYACTEVEYTLFTSGRKGYTQTIGMQQPNAVCVVFVEDGNTIGKMDGVVGRLNYTIYAKANISFAKTKSVDASNVIYVATYEDNVYAFNLDGKLMGSVPNPEVNLYTPLVERNRQW